MIRFVRGSLFDADVHTLVNPVNKVGVSGAGLAKEFKRRYPEMHTAYARACKRGELGWIWMWTSTESDAVLCFPTKEHWRDPSTLGLIELGLSELVRTYRRLGITSIAFPALGCGNGGLDWADVKPLMTRYLERLEIPVAIHGPIGSEQ